MKPLIAYKWSGWHIAKHKWNSNLSLFLLLLSINTFIHWILSSRCDGWQKNLTGLTLKNEKPLFKILCFTRINQFSWYYMLCWTVKGFQIFHGQNISIFQSTFYIPKKRSIENATIVSTETYVELRVEQSYMRKEGRKFIITEKLLMNMKRKKTKTSLFCAFHFLSFYCLFGFFLPRTGLIWLLNLKE